MLDELDGLLCHGEDKFLYDIARAGNGKPMFNIIGISNKAKALTNLDSRIRSTVGFSVFELKPYTQAQIFDILSERARIGLAPGSWDEGIISACANRSASRRGNLHLGLELLLESAKTAERANRRTIALSDVEAAWSAKPEDGETGVSKIELNIQSASLSDEERVIVDIVKRGEIDSNTLYDLFRLKLRRTARQIRHYLKSLEAKGLISARDMATDSPIGNMKIFKLGCPS